MSENILEMREIVKEFSTVRVLDHVNFSLRPGEVHALMGANGAGKSTLMKILNGIYTLTSGSVLFDGKEVTIGSPREAYELGISMIHQELDLVGCRDVAENIYLGREIFKDKAKKILDRNAMHKEAQALIDELGFDLDAKAPVDKLSPAKQQLVLIARTVSCNSKVVVMDEPTSSLSHSETQQLFKVIRDLRKKNIAVIYISHYLEEIFEVSDRLTVLKNGQTVTTAVTKECTPNQLVKWMIGRETEVVKNIGDPKNENEIILECNHLETKRNLIHDVSYHIRKGEIIGFAGVVGSGRTEIANMLMGAEAMKSGEIKVDGKSVRISSPTAASKLGINIVCEDRKQEGLITRLNIGTNMWLSYLGKNRSPFLDFKTLRKKVDDMIGFMSVKCEGQNQLVSDLSGGNQQKIAIGKCLLNQPKVLIMDQPTRGVDVGAKGEIYGLVTDLAKESGTAILYISDELEELIALCDRIYVIKQGRCIQEVDNHTEEVTKASLLAKMVG